MGEKGNPEFFEPGPIIGERGGELLQQTTENEKPGSTPLTSSIDKPQTSSGQSEVVDEGLVRPAADSTPR